MTLTRSLKSVNNLLELEENLTDDKVLLFSNIEDEVQFYLSHRHSQLILATNDFQTYRDKLQDTWPDINDWTFKLNEDTGFQIRVLDSYLRSPLPIPDIAFNIFEFETSGFDHEEPCHHQFVCKSSKKYLLNKYFSRDFIISVNSERWNNLFNGLTIELYSKNYILYCTDDLLVIESMDPVKFNIFQQAIFTITYSLAFITGSVHIANSYIFQYETNSFYEWKEMLRTEKFQKSYSSEINFINPKRSEAEAFPCQVHYLSKKSFETLCVLLLEFEDIARAIILILQANQSSLEAKGALYSVVLETLTAHIAQANKEKLKPLTKKQGCELIEKLHEIANKYFERNYTDSPIFKRIQEINSPTNTDILSKTFELVQISLSENDIKIINHRNTYLHGRKPMAREDFIEGMHDLLYINYKLCFFVYALLFKISGHSGRILNLAKVQGIERDGMEDEEWYLDIGPSLEI